MADSITGISELASSFKRLSADMQKRIAPKMVVAAGGIIRKEAKAKAQSAGLFKTGALINNIVIKRERNVQSGTVQYNVGVRHGRALGNSKKVIKYLARSKTGRIITKRKNDPFYWRFLEFGTEFIQPVHFIGSAFESKHQQAIAAMGIVLQKETIKANT